GVLRPRYDAPVGPPQPGTPTRRDIFAGKGYLPVTLMQFSRGCRFTCSFCAVSSYFDKTHYTRAVNEVVAEIQGLPRKQIIFFVDDNIVSDFAAAKALCRALIPLNVHWVSQGSIDMTRDPELMDLLVRSGCIGMVIGFESISRESLRDMRKAPNFVGGFDAYRPQLEILRDHGLQLWAAFTLGHDHDTRDSILETLAFAKENRFALAAFNILVPYPNTPLYRRLEAEGRLLYDGQWWLHPDYRFNYAAFRPRHMTPDELTELCWQCRAEYNELGFLIRRMFDLKTNLRTLTKLSVYLRYSPIFRREVFKKHGMRFGLH
ncbi:MAG: radical SAM protein, partial [Caldilineaceae bacterium]|nr:radical SAM protein [Caldilineaceae bacterium]